MSLAYQSRTPHLNQDPQRPDCSLQSHTGCLPACLESNQGGSLGRLLAVQQTRIMPEASLEATALPVAIFGFCAVWRLDPLYVLCSLLKATLDFQDACSDEARSAWFFPYICSMTYQDPLMDAPGLCTEMADFFRICKISRTNPSDLALGFFEHSQSVSSVSFFYLLLHTSPPGEWDLFPFSSYLRSYYNQEWVVQEQKGMFRASGENGLILHRIIKYSLVNRGRGLFCWDGKAMGGPYRLPHGESISVVRGRHWSFFPETTCFSHFPVARHVLEHPPLRVGSASSDPYYSFEKASQDVAEWG